MVRSRRGFYFFKITILGILGHAHLGKMTVFLIFGAYGSRFCMYLVHIWYVVGTWLVHGWHVVGTWLVRGGYVVGTWLVRGFVPNCRNKGPMRIVLTI